MKKLFVLGLLLAMSSGCGRGWFPHLFRGAPCGGLCSRSAPAAEQNCTNCPSAGYESYGSSENVMGGDIIGSAPISPTYESVGPSMTPLPSNIVSPRQ